MDVVTAVVRTEETFRTKIFLMVVVFLLIFLKMVVTVLVVLEEETEVETEVVSITGVEIEEMVFEVDTAVVTEEITEE